MRDQFQTNDLPPDVKEVYFSGKYWYAASKDSTATWRKPKFVGSGNTKDEAINDMRTLSNDRKGETE